LPAESIERLLERVGLVSYADRDVSNLSGGEAQRVSLARILANTPEVLLLDEPTSALDEATQRGVEDLICSIIHQGRLTCLIVTHDTQQAARLATHVMVMERGKLVEFGPVEEVLDA
jgi:putative ABC transport system ATP-binding protein